jgi:hypothetical protein
MREDPPQTVESIRLALAAQAAERERVKQECGIHFDGDRPYLPGKVLTMPIPPRRIPWDSQLDCDEAIDLAVETYGLEAVVRALRLVAAANGRSL